MNEPASNCCHAPVRIAHSRYEDRPSYWYVCTKCGKPCDVEEGS